MTWHKVPVE